MKKDNLEANVHGFMNVWFAANNMPLQRIVNGTFEDEEKEHIDKLVEVSNHDFFSFITTLDERNRGRVIVWIMENYNGVDLDSIQQYYLSESDDSCHGLDNVDGTCGSCLICGSKDNI